MSRRGIRVWVVDLVAGGLAGLGVAWIVAVNLVITSVSKVDTKRGWAMSSDTLWCLASSSSALSFPARLWV